MMKVNKSVSAQLCYWKQLDQYSPSHFEWTFRLLSLERVHFQFKGPWWYFSLLFQILIAITFYKQNVKILFGAVWSGYALLVCGSRKMPHLCELNVFFTSDRLTSIRERLYLEIQEYHSLLVWVLTSDWSNLTWMFYSSRLCPHTPFTVFKQFHLGPWMSALFHECVFQFPGLCPLRLWWRRGSSQALG